jgi:hypothetical protein
MKNKILCIIMFFYLNNGTAQCTINSSGCGDYRLNISITAMAVVPSTFTCPSGYNYNIQFSYSITVIGRNTCFNGNIGIQPQILCNGQNNGYFTILVPAPTVGNAATSVTYTGTLTTTSNPFNGASDCNTATPVSLNCNSLQVTVFGPGIATATYPCNLAPLPIELLFFTGQCKKQNVTLNWSTATETNNDFFTVERSYDAINFSIIKTIKGAGNSISLLNYAYTDMKLYNGISYYRLKQTDFDGNYKYSEIIIVENCENVISADNLTIYPNPSNGQLSLLLNGVKEQFNSIEIYNVLGERIYYSKTFQSLIDLANQPSGIYFIAFNFNSTIITKEIVIEK